MIHHLGPLPCIPRPSARKLGAGSAWTRERSTTVSQVLRCRNPDARLGRAGLASYRGGEGGSGEVAPGPTRAERRRRGRKRRPQPLGTPPGTHDAVGCLGAAIVGTQRRAELAVATRGRRDHQSGSSPQRSGRGSGLPRPIGARGVGGASVRPMKRQFCQSGGGPSSGKDQWERQPGVVFFFPLSPPPDQVACAPD